MKHYLKVPSWLTLCAWTGKNRLISDGDFRVFLFLANQARKHGYCFASERFIAAMLRKHVDTVRRALRHLRAAEWIEVTRGKQHETNKITVMPLDSPGNDDLMFDQIRKIKKVLADERRVSLTGRLSGSSQSVQKCTP